MSAALIALLVSAGVSVWIFTKLQNRTGSGNNKDAITGAGVVFVLLYLATFTAIHFFLHN